ncbi:MAG: C40 family peptidase [Clostridium sp.]|nr:C40 family peptidase [Prevotella sp.]MCM1429654.1 C40 family peptidase [Clostridium sp.]MCM1474656.1 C40 family peptidase [Muribaculaceae bacterium]
MKKLKKALTILMIATCAFTGAAQKKNSSARKAHEAAHKAMLADHRQGMDNTVISGIIQQDVQGRENHGGNFSAASRSLSNDIITEAFRHLGKPYVWGAKGPSQFDCSGFTSYVYRQFGYSISPGSRIQYTQGRAVARKDIRKGDLVFFTSPRSGSAVGHVGICVDSDQSTGTFTFVHASLRGVKVSSITENYYSRRFIGARRVIAD